MVENYRSRMALLAIKRLPDAVIMVDPQRIITEFNPAAERLSGYSRQEARGRHCGDVLRGSLCGERCPLLAALHGKRMVKDAEAVIKTKDERQVPVMISTSTLLGPQGQLLGAVEVIKDLSDIKRAERERQNLLTMLAHDMKAPVTVIGGFACQLLRALELGQKERGHLEIIRDEAQRLTDFITEFLSYSRLEAGGLTPSCSACNLDSMVCRVVEAFLPEAQSKGIFLSLKAPADPVVVDADEELLERALTNLVSNAVKFTGQGGEIVVEIAGQEGSAEVSVADTGCGIPAEHLPYIFEPFNRGAASKPGTGLGLAIVEAVAKVHSGKALVASEPGRGSTFVLRLPLRQGAGTGANPLERG